MPDQLLKRWNDWSAGIGYPNDDGRTPGMYYAAGLLGLAGELRPAPVFNEVATSLKEVTMAYFIDGNETYHRGVHTCLNPAASTAPTAIDSLTTSVANTFAHTVTNTGSNRCLIVGIVTDTAVDPTGVTYDGAAMTKIGSDAGSYQLTLWYKHNPTAGSSENVVITHGTAAEWCSFAIAFQDVDSGTPVSGTHSDVHICDNYGPIVAIVTVVANGTIVGAKTCVDGVTTTVPPGQVNIGNKDSAAANIVASSRVVPTNATDHHFQYFFEAPANADPYHPFLYAIRGFKSNAGVTLHKIDISNGDFGTFEASSTSFTAILPPLLQPGQPARYKGFWWLPEGNDKKPRQLSVVGVGDHSTDTITAGDAAFVDGSDHLTLLNAQMVGHVKKGVSGVSGAGGVGDEDGGVRILKVDGAPGTSADWGSAFPAGEGTERAGGIITLQGATFVLNREGMYSFNERSRSWEVFSDLRQWQNPHQNTPMSTWRGGIVFPHPAGGLMFYELGKLPVPFGVDAKSAAWNLPNSAVTELHSGKYHSTSVAGDLLYAVYQPNVTDTTALVVVAYTPTGNPADSVWQCLGTITLNDAEYMSGVHVATSSRPSAATYVTPTAWFNNAADLNYVTLDSKASPFRSRADTHKVTLSANADMSVLEFTEPTDLTRIVVHTSSDMVDGDEWQISLIADGTGREENVGAPIKGSGTRHERKLDRHAVSRLTLRVNWTATSTSARVPPVVTRIELYGNPEKGIASARA